MILLLRAINVGRGRTVPMAELRALATTVGLTEARTYLQSGNLRGTSEEDPVAVADRLEATLLKRFGFAVPVIARRTVDWEQIVATCPFPDAARDRPKLLHVAVARDAPPDDAAARLTERASPRERVAVAGGALWIDYADGVGRSKLAPTLLDRVVGAPVTARNWRTAQALLTL